MGLKEKMGKPPVAVSICAVLRGGSELSKADMADLLEMVSDSLWPVETLQRRLRENGVTISADGIKKHRRKLCACFPAKGVEPDGSSGSGRKR